MQVETCESARYVLVGVAFRACLRLHCRFLHVCGSSSVKFGWQFWTRPGVCLTPNLLCGSKCIPEAKYEQSKHISHSSRHTSPSHSPSLWLFSVWHVLQARWGFCLFIYFSNGRLPYTCPVSSWSPVLASLTSFGKECPAVLFLFAWRIIPLCLKPFSVCFSLNTSTYPCIRKVGEQSLTVFVLNVTSIIFKYLSCRLEESWRWY